MVSRTSWWNSDENNLSEISSFSKKKLSAQNNIPSSDENSTDSAWSSDSNWSSEESVRDRYFSETRPQYPRKSQRSSTTFSRSSWNKNISKALAFFSPLISNKQKGYWSSFKKWGGNFMNFFKSGKLRTILLSCWGILFASYIIWVYVVVASQLPVITNETLQDGNFSQTSIMSDRNGEALYRFYEQNRRFVNYDDIAPQMINAFVAIEDQSFWRNGGVDMKGIVRNIYNSFKRVLGINVRVSGASTITQQLLKNILALDKNEKWLYDKVVRKHKERLLVGKLADVIKTDIKKKNPGISSEDLDRKSKERVMELYVNFIYLGNQAYGVQASAQSYFSKNAKDLSIVESAILASMAQSPVSYDLYKNPSRVRWKLDILTTDGELISSWEVYNTVVNTIGNNLFGTSSVIGKWNNTFQNFIATIVPSNLTIWWSIYTISYTIGRKDAVLNRMYEDWYITEDELKQAFIDGLNLKLSSGKVDIKAPHFVFWVRDLILQDPTFADLNISEDMLYQWWLQIKTSLDYSIQQIAEQSVRDNMALLYDRGGNNRSMIHVDTVNGDILAYVGSADYNNEAIWWQNDMVRNKRQPGSSIKPLIYTYLLQNVPSTIDTPIYDISFTVGWLTPNNADGKFEGPLPLKKALAYSRNIPAVKAYLAAGQEEKIKPFLQEMGMKSIKLNHEYGYSLALGAGEVSVLEVAQAYATMSQLGKQVTLNPILEIKDKNGNILYQKEIEEKETSLSPVVASLMWNILSDPSNQPPGWVSAYRIPGLKYAVKSGTSNKVIKRDGRDVSVPRDGWLLSYTPTTTTIYWAGNADDKPMNASALSLTINSEINKSFLGKLLQEEKLKNDPMPTVPGAKTVTISKITGRIATESTPEEYRVETIWYNVEIPADGTYTTISVDNFCGGKISPLTPPEQRQRVLLFNPASITSFDSQDIINWYLEQNKFLTDPNNSYARLFTKEPTEYCEGRQVEISDSIQVTASLTKNQSVTTKFTLSFWAVVNQWTIKSMTILANDIVMGQYNYNTAEVDDTKTINLISIGEEVSNVMIQVMAVNDQWKVNSITIPVKRVQTDTDQPSLDNTATKIVSTESWYEVTLGFTDKTSGVESVSVTLPDGSQKNLQWSLVKFITTTVGIITYSAKDSFGNTLEGTLDMNNHI